MVVPFWAKRDYAVYPRNVLARDVRDLKNLEHAEDAVFCTCHFDGTELLSPRASIKGASIHILSEMLLTNLAAVRRNFEVEYRKPSSSSVDEKTNQVTSESDAKDRLRLPIVFVTHSLASWVVRHLLAGRSYDNTSIMFATRGIVFLDTPHENNVTLPEGEHAEEYLKGLSYFLRGRTDTQSSMVALAKELTVIDRAFEDLQNSAFVRNKKAHVMGGPAVAVHFKEIWAIISANGLMTFQEKRSINDKKIGSSRLRKILRIDQEDAQLEKTKAGRSSHIVTGGLDSLLEIVLGAHRRLHEHDAATKSSFRNDPVIPPENHLILSSGTLLQPPEAILEGVEASTPSWEDSKSTNRSASPDPLGDRVKLAGQTSPNLGLRLIHSRRDSSGDSITSDRSDITQPAALKAFAYDPAYGKAYTSTIRLANSYYQRAEFVNAEAAFRRSKELLEAAMGPSVRQAFEFIAIDEQLAAISLYRGQYSKAEVEFESLLKKTHRLEQIPTAQKKGLVQDLKRWTAVVMLHQGQYRNAVLEFKTLLQDGQFDEHQLRIHIHRDLSLALAHLGPYSHVREQIKLAEEELENYTQTQESVLHSVKPQTSTKTETEVTAPEAVRIKSNAQASTTEKASRSLQRKTAVKRAYLRFVQAMIYHLWGFYDKALERCEEAANGLEERLGGRHMKTLECASLKAFLLAKNYHLSSAEACCSQTLHTMRKELDPRHPHTLEATGRLVYIFTAQYRLAEATATAASLKKSTKKTFGDDHPQTLNSQLLLSQVNLATGDYMDALGQLQELVKASEHFYGEENLITLTHNATYARALYHAGALEEAEEVAQSTLRMQRRFFSLPSGLDTKTQDICLFSQRLIRERLEAMDQEVNYSRIHPLFLTTLETIALVEMSKTYPDRISARGILECCWRWKSHVLGEDHAFTLAAEYEFAMAFEDEDDDNGGFLQHQQHMRHIYSRRIATLEETHPDVLTARRELIIINCALGTWMDLPTPSEARSNVQVGREGVDDGSKLIDNAVTGKTMDDEAWAVAESESQMIFSMHKMKLGGAHPETLKSQLWLFQLRVQLGQDVDTQTYMRDLLSELRGPKILSQRLVDSVRIRHQMALALRDSGHLRQAARILHQIPEELKAAPLAQNSSFTETLEQLRQATDQNILETMREAQRHPDYKARLHELLSKAEAIKKANNETKEAREYLSEAFELCELLYGPDHPKTHNARERLVLATWNPQDESKMREAIKQMSELIAFLNTTSGTAQGKELTKTYDQWVLELDARTKDTDLEDEPEE